MAPGASPAADGHSAEAALKWRLRLFEFHLQWMEDDEGDDKDKDKEDEDEEDEEQYSAGHPKEEHS